MIDGVRCAWVIGVYEGAAPAVASAENGLKESHPKEWEIFSALDADASGALDKDELWVKLSSMGEEQATQLIDMVDMNGVSAPAVGMIATCCEQTLAAENRAV